MSAQEAERRDQRLRVRRPSTGFFLGSGFVALALVFFFSSWALPAGKGDPGPGFVPLIVSALALILLIPVLVGEVFGRERTRAGEGAREDADEGHTSVAWRQLVFVALLMIYYVCLPIVGFLACTGVFLVIVFKLFGVPGFVGPIVASAAVTAVVYFAFVEIFRIPLSAI